MVITINVYMSNKEKCFACSSVPENVLVLSCNHCICLLCASKEVQGSPNSNYYCIACHRCEDTTEIEDDLYQQLMELVAQAPKIPNKKHQHVLNKQPPCRQAKKYTPHPYDEDLERTCNWHPQYPIMYVCKTCYDVFICPECLLNGCHKSHEANAIQKEGEKIKGKLQQDLGKVNEKIEQLEKMQQARVASIEQRRRELQKLRNVAKRQYEEIRQAIIKEQNTVIAKCNELISTHQKEEESFKQDIAYQIKTYENQRIDLIDLLNPLLEDSISGQSRALQKMMMVNLVQSYKKFTKVCQRDRQNYIKIAEEKMEEDLEVIQSLTKKIDQICIANFYQPKSQLVDNSAPRKYNYPMNEANKLHYPPMNEANKLHYPIKDTTANTITQQMHNKHAPNRQTNKPKNDFFKLL